MNNQEQTTPLPDLFFTGVVNNLPSEQKFLPKLLETQEKLKCLISKNIEFSKPIITQNEKPVIFPNTINVIQGQSGAHKSRLAEYFCAVLLKLIGILSESLGLKRTSYSASTSVAYIDSERNLADQLPFALQNILLLAGYDLTYHPLNFHYISLLEIPRKHRFPSLEEYIIHLRGLTTDHLFIVLDVSTDCIEDFNKTDKSMELIDLMNIAINKYNVTFLAIIHENPKSEKARGHFGTELMNKASTVIQVSFVKDASQGETNLIQAKFLKCRSTEKHQPFYMKYEGRGLVLADSNEVNEAKDSRKTKLNTKKLVEAVEIVLEGGRRVLRKEFLEDLEIELNVGERTIEKGLKEIIDLKSEIKTKEGCPCTLIKEREKKEVYYSLLPSSSFF